MITATAVHVASGGTWPDYPEAGRWPLFGLNFIAVLLVGGPLGEELGWRGYALPRLGSDIDLPAAGILLGLLWAIWHMPLFLVPSSPQAHLPFLWFSLQAVALGLVLALLWEATGRSLLLPVLLHASVNSFAGPLRILPPEADGLRPYILTVGLTWVLALWLGWTRRHARSHNESAN
jgi:membrane protease YdiL (CAAX protease family)